MKICVAGGAGFIGSHVARALLEAGHTVTVLDNLSTGHHELVPADAAFVQADLADPRLPELLAGHETVIHLAALVPVPTSVKRPVEFAENNVVNTVRLLEAMRRASVRHIVFSSSATVYGQPASLPIREDAPVSVQSNPYGASKVAAEAFIAAYNRLHGLDATILRYFNPYGPNELCEPETHAIPNFVRAALLGEPIPLYWRGEQVRDFIYVEDLARAHAAVVGCEGLGYYNVGSEQGTRISDVLTLIERIVGRPLVIDHLGERPGDVPALYSWSEKLRGATGWQADVGLEDGLKLTVDFFRRRLQV